jgi:PilZ domain-containing protein
MKRQINVNAMDETKVQNARARPSMDTETSDHRLQPRRPYTGRVVRFGGGGTEFAAVDLSPMGVGLLSPQPLMVGQRIELSFLGGSIVVKGSVSHVHGGENEVWHVGVDFLQAERELTQVALALSSQGSSRAI